MGTGPDLDTDPGRQDAATAGDGPPCGLMCEPGESFILGPLGGSTRSGSRPQMPTGKERVVAAVPIDLGTKPFVEYPTLGNAAFVDAWEQLEYLWLLAAMDGGVGPRTPVQPR